MRAVWAIFPCLACGKNFISAEFLETHSQKHQVKAHAKIVHASWRVDWKRLIKLKGHHSVHETMRIFMEAGIVISPERHYYQLVKCGKIMYEHREGELTEFHFCDNALKHKGRHNENARWKGVSQYD